MFEKSLSDLVRGIRNHRQDEGRYIGQCVEEIKAELRQENMPMKANAVAKLIYLQMLGYDISWAAFNIIEVMSSSKFIYKRIGYLAASQSFHDDTDVLMLTTNMIRKDLSSQSTYEAGVALTGLSCFVSPELARDLANDVMTLLASTKPFLRKKSILLMYKIFLKFPDALRPAFGRLKDKVDDPDPGVQCAAVNVICELARKNPKNYLSMAPMFFKLMTSSSNNWMLIKIIKLFGALTPLEPRLGKKLIDPLTNLIHSTSAMSLLYECINTIVAGMPNHTASIQLCVSKLRVMVEDPDQNLKYLGLRAFAQILKHHPKVVSSHKDLILDCLEDRDESIRVRALDLLYGMVTKKNIVEIVKKLMGHMDKAEGQNYRDEVLAKVIEICMQSNYQHVTNFEWYITVLVELTSMESTRHGRLIANSLLDVTIRVKSVRPFAVKQMGVLLDNSHLLRGTSQRNGICEVLFSAAWICGEFASMLPSPRAAIEAMLKPQSTALPGHIQAVFVQNVVKLFAFVIKENLGDEGDEDEVAEVQALLEGSLPMYIQSGDLEVQERACSAMQLLKYMRKCSDKGQDISAEVVALFDGEMNPVAPKAQRKVPVPEGLDLDKWINDPPSDSEEEADGSFGEAFFSEKEEVRTKSKKEIREEEEELERRREEKRQERAGNLYYLPVAKPVSKKTADSTLLVEAIPVAQLQLDIPLEVSGGKRPGKRGKRPGKRSQKVDAGPRPVVATAVDMPDDAAPSDGDEDSALAVDDPHRALADISLDEPLRDDEVLPVRTHRIVSDKAPEPEPKVRVRRKKDGKGSTKGGKKKRDKKKHGEAAKEEPEGDLVQLGDDAAPEPAVAEAAPKKKKGKKSKAGGEEDAATAAAAEGPAASTGDMDDLAFWLSASDAPAAAPAAAASVASPPAAAAATHTVPVDEKKKKKSKKTEKEEKGKKKKKSKATGLLENGDTASDRAALAEVGSGMQAYQQLEAVAVYTPLAKDKIIELRCQMRCVPQQRNQVIVSVLFQNHCEHQLTNLDLNVLDSLNTKMIRPMGAKAQDGIMVPFQLPSGTANEAQFGFTVDSIIVPQKLRGTLTYMIQTPDGATSSKIDFKVPMPCSSFIFPMPITSKNFADLLAGGELCEAKSTKVPRAKSPDFATALTSICSNLHLAVVEILADSASLHGCSIQQHHVCMLVKETPDHAGVSVNCKSSDATLATNIIDEIKALV